MKIASLLSAVSLASFCQGATLVSFTFPASNALVATSVATNVSSTNLALTTGGNIETNITFGTYFPNEPYIEETGGWAATSQSSAKAFTLTLTAAAGYTIDITNVSFNAYATAAGPSAIGVTVGSTAVTAVNAPNASLVSVDASVTGQDGLSSVTILVQGWLNGSRTTAGSGAFRLDDLVVSGNVNAIPVPEPGFALLGGLGILGIFRRRRY